MTDTLTTIIWTLIAFAFSFALLASAFAALSGGRR